MTRSWRLSPEIDLYNYNGKEAAQNNTIGYQIINMNKGNRLMGSIHPVNDKN